MSFSEADWLGSDGDAAAEVEVAVSTPARVFQSYEPAAADPNVEDASVQVLIDERYTAPIVKSEAAVVESTAVGHATTVAVIDSDESIGPSTSSPVKVKLA